MDPIIGVWLTSLVGAAAFSTGGYVLGQRGVVLPLFGLPKEPRKERAEEPNVHTMPTPVAISRSELTSAKSASERPPANDADDEDRPTVVPDTAIQAAAFAKAVASIPPATIMQLEGLKADLDAAIAKADKATNRAREAEASKGDLERQIETLRAKLQTETARADELGDRLAGASAEASNLRHKVSQLDKQTKQLREALQGRVRALTTSELSRRRELDETEEIRAKLREVEDKLERSSSLPPGPPVPKTTSIAAPRTVTTADIETTALRDEIARLMNENRELRAHALGMAPKQRASGAMQNVDVAVYQQLIRRVGTVAGLRSAVIADETGSILVGSGDLAEELAAFGAYIRDASSRSDRLLPLDAVEEVDIRDRKGMLLSTRLVASAPSELSIVLLGGNEAALVTAKKIVVEHIKQQGDWI